MRCTRTTGTTTDADNSRNRDGRKTRTAQNGDLYSPHGGNGLAASRTIHVNKDNCNSRQRWTLKSCLRAANAPSKGHAVAFKDPLLQFHFYYYPNPNDIWSRCGLLMRPARKSFISFLLTLDRSPASHSRTPETSYLLNKGPPCYIDWIQPSTVFFSSIRNHSHIL